MMSPGIKSGVNWTRLNFRFSTCAMVRTVSVLAMPGQADQKGVAIGQDAHEDLVEHVALADDDFADLVANALGVDAHFLDQRQFVGVRDRRARGRTAATGFRFNLRRCRNVRRRFDFLRGQAFFHFAAFPQGDALLRGGAFFRGVLFENEAAATDLDEIARGKPGRGHGLAVQLRAIGTAQIDDLPTTIFEPKFRMGAGCHAVVELQVHIGAASQ